ncbi:MAG: deoxyribonuclease IV [Candidatus Kapaibacterium sp.]
MLLGAHVSTAGGLATAFERAALLKINTFQIFVKNNKQWFAKPLEAEDISSFKAARKAWVGEGPLVAHACYLINLASGNPEILERSQKSYMDELLRADALGVEQLVFHPGSFVGTTEEEGLKNVVRSLDLVHKETKGTKTLSVIEITAGQGSSIGCKFEHLERVLHEVKDPKRVRVCLDTCHMFAAGYDIRTADVWEKSFRQFESQIGFENLVSVHTNDSKKGLGTRVDRHEQIGKGEIGLEAFRLLMNDVRFDAIPKILETPKDDKMTEDYVNLKLLRGLVGKKSAKQAKA